MKISRVRLRVFEDAVNEVYKSCSISRYCFFEPENEDKVVYEVNWSCRGAVSAKEAETFSEELQSIVKLAKYINGLKLEIDWDLEDEFIKSKEEARQKKAKLIDDLKKGNHKEAWVYFSM